MIESIANPCCLYRVGAGNPLDHVLAMSCRLTISFHFYSTSDLLIPPLPQRLSSRPFPRYAFVPGIHPHPVSGVGGHRYEHGAEDGRDQQSIRRLHCLAIDLVNHGYYWESHEAWEMIWIAASATTTRARFLKGLIKLAAAGVKARQGSTTGVRRHSERAAALFLACEQDATFDGQHEFGLTTMSLYQSSTQLAERADSIVDPTVCSVRRVLPFVLVPDFHAVNTND